jgi:hypothetical protein
MAIAMFIIVVSFAPFALWLAFDYWVSDVEREPKFEHDAAAASALRYVLGE